MKRLDLLKVVAVLSLVVSAAPALAADALTAKHEIAASANQAQGSARASIQSGDSSTGGTMVSCSCNRQREAQGSGDSEPTAARETVRRDTWASRNE